MDAIVEYLSQHSSEWLWLALYAVLSNLLFVLLAALLLGYMPADALVRWQAPQPWWLVWLRNLLGSLLVLVGLLLLVLPGPGFAMIVAGLVVVRSERKNRWLLKLLEQRSVRRFIERARRRLGQPPVIWPNPEGPRLAPGTGPGTGPQA